MSDPVRARLLKIYSAALAAVDGATRTHDWLQANPIDSPLVLLAAGKAACAMARGAHAALGTAIADAFIVTRYGHGETLPWPVIEAGHPVPDAGSLAAGEQLDAFVASIPPAAVVLVLLSGGASAVLERLPKGVALADLQVANQWLLASGLDIHVMNAVRKRLSCIKSGRLARRLHPRTVTCLAISDVPGDDPGDIGSGPLTPDAAALDESSLPPFIRALLVKAPPLPPVGDPCFQNVRYAIVADNADARRAAARAAGAQGWRVESDVGLLHGDASLAGRSLAQRLLAAPSGVLHVWGGETTVRLPPNPGRGGRCQTLALAAARELAGRENVWILAAGTDGRDGPGEDAGALVDGGTVARGSAEGQRVDDALARADAGRFLEASGDLVQTGPTGTNVMDLVLGLRL